jgi:PknH-like extracellular domain
MREGVSSHSPSSAPPSSSSPRFARIVFCNLGDHGAIERVPGTIRFTSNPNQGPFVDESVYSFPSDRRAKAFVKAAADQASACTAPWQSTPSGLPTGASARFTIAPLAFPKVAGDQVLAARETATEQLNGEDLQTATSDQVLVRRANHVLLVGYTATSPDPKPLQTYLRKAYSKFGAELQNVRRHSK